jgi:hypothetical protein
MNTLTDADSKSWTFDAVVVELAAIKGRISMANVCHIHPSTVLTGTPQCGVLTTLEGLTYLINAHQQRN